MLLSMSNTLILPQTRFLEQRWKVQTWLNFTGKGANFLVPWILYHSPSLVRMKNNLQEQLRWLEEEYDFQNDPLILVAKENLAKLYCIPSHYHSQNFTRNRGEDISIKAKETPMISAPRSISSIDKEELKEFQVEENLQPHPAPPPSSPKQNTFELGSFDLSDGFFETDALTHFIPRLSINGKSDGSRLKEAIEFEEDPSMDDIDQEAMQDNFESHPESDPFEPFQLNHRINKRDDVQIRKPCMSTTENSGSVETRPAASPVLPVLQIPAPIEVSPPLEYSNTERNLEIREVSSLMKELQSEKTRISIEICDLMEQLDNVHDDSSSSHITSMLSELRRKRYEYFVLI